MKRTHLNRGQALVLVTLALFAMCGLIGLAVDLGWAFFVRRAAQGAADAAAMAAVIQGLTSLGNGAAVCGSNLTCQAITPCPNVAGAPTTNIENGCLYASRNGFSQGGNSNRQTVTMEAAVPLSACTSASPPNCVPTAPGVAAYYWATARVTETVPQLFSAVLGNANGLVAARATAAIADSVVIGSLILLNRESDEAPVDGYRGMNFVNNGGPTVSAPGGIVLSSNCNGTNCQDGNSNNYAGRLTGSGSITANWTIVRGVGQACAGNIQGCSGTGQSTWTVPPSNGAADDSRFLDPYRGYGQPALRGYNAGGWGNQTGVTLDHPLIAGNIVGSNDPNNPTLIYPGVYYATGNQQTSTPSGNAITISGYVKFVSTNNFGQWVFIGGVRTAGGAATLEFTPGRYVFAGQNQGCGNQSCGGLFTLDNGTTILDQTPVGVDQTDAGQLLLYTDLNYAGIQDMMTNIDNLNTYRNTLNSQLTFGQSGFTMGNNAQSSIILHGLNRDHSTIASEGLQNFAPVVIWQDQQNSRVKYTTSGNIDTTTCGSATLNAPCTNSPENTLMRQMKLQATPNTRLYGAVYQPRGAWLDLQGGGTITAPLRIVTGAVNLGGNPNLTLTSTADPIVRRTVAMVE